MDRGAWWARVLGSKELSTTEQLKMIAWHVKIKYFRQRNKGMLLTRILKKKKSRKELLK